MKNIFIIGVPRSGKSTLSKLIKEKYPIYNQLSFEAIRNGFLETQQNLNMDNKKSDARKNILPKHIVTLAHWNNKISSYQSLVEGDFCSVEELYHLVNENDDIICLGLGCRTIEEIIDGIRNYDTNNDYTKELTDKQIKNHFYDIVNEDKANYEFCLKNNIKYYDTYERRNDIFIDILQMIK